MRVRHPYALTDDAPPVDARVHWGGRRDWSDVDEDGTFHVPDDRAAEFVEGWPDADGYPPERLLLADGESGASDGTADEAALGSDSDDDGSCAGTTAAGDPCSNPAGEDGYCHLPNHGPEDE